MKMCSHCKKNQEDKEFYKRKEGKDWLTSWCRNCQMERSKKYYYDSPGKLNEKNKEYKRKYQSTEEFKKKRTEYYKRPEVRKRLNENQKKRRESQKYKLMRMAETIAYHAYKRHGKILKIPCEKCGNIKSEMHHDNYLEPLKVKWFCKIHHEEYHRLKGDKNGILDTTNKEGITYMDTPKVFRYGTNGFRAGKVAQEAIIRDIL